MEISLQQSLLAILSCFLMVAPGFGLAQLFQSNCSMEGVEIEGGDYIVNTELQSGSLLVYRCPEGYYPYPAMFRQCRGNRWKPAPKRFLRQKCKLVECPDPNVLEYGSVSPPQERYFAGNETTYECYSGFKMRGSSRRMCLKNGKWSGRTPICSQDTTGTCADPGIPPGAIKTGNIYDFHDVVTYYCKDNLILVGSKERVCQENGQWTGKEPACYYQHTYDTPLEVSEAFGSTIIESLTTLDDTQAGKTIRISKNGTLNIYIAVDISESIDKEQFEKARDAVLKLITKISSFSVTPNYEIVFFSSEVIEVVDILEFFGGKGIRDTMRQKIMECSIDGRNTGTDLTAVFNKFLEKMAIVKIRVGEEAFKKHHHVFLIFTDGGYNMGGSPLPSVTRIKNMVYMNQTGENQGENRDEYLDIYVFAVGIQIFDDDLQPLIAGTGGQHYFRMKDVTNLQKTFDDIIDEREVRGLCGLHKSYATDRGKHPWYAAIVVTTDGQTSKCFGSLVTRKLILTAAHCFKFGNVPADVVVEIDDGQGQIKKVENFFLHPNYNVNAKENEGVKEFYDYDVALIQLEEEVKLSTDVRPICIPCTRQTSEALKLVGVSTCKQQEQALLTKGFEKLNFLTRTDEGIKEKDVFAKLGDNRKECIKHALAAPGITTKKVEEAVTENFLCTGGLSHQREHIACKGDSGGAVFKTYEHRTIQVGVVSWGTSNLCSTGGLVESEENSRDFHINLFRVVPFLRSIIGDDNQDDYSPLEFLKE
ncbi:unnamed protein product [Ophioblennius macclurei]